MKALEVFSESFLNHYDILFYFSTIIIERSFSSFNKRPLVTDPYDFIDSRYIILFV